MSQIINTVSAYMPERLKKLTGLLERPDSTHATHPSDTPFWQLTKRYALKFWDWLTTDNWKWVLAAFFIAGIVHILAVINLPDLAPKSAWFRLKDKVPSNKMMLLPPLDKEAAMLPMMAPDIRYAICRYDLTKGAVSVKTKIPNELFSVAVYNRLGQNFYIISGQSLQRDELFLIVTQDKNTAETEVSASEKSDNDVVVINSSDSKGILLLRAPVTGPAYEQHTENILRNATCSTDQ